jgi:hypothetical protein
MKYIIILYLCSFSGPETQCMPGRVLAFEFDSYNNCILEGYKQAYLALNELDNKQVNNEKLAIKFDCKELKVEKI